MNDGMLKIFNHKDRGFENLNSFPLLNDIIKLFSCIGYVAGGAARYATSGDLIYTYLKAKQMESDIDIFLYKESDFNKGITILQKMGLSCQDVSKVAASFTATPKIYAHYKEGGALPLPKVQLIRSVFGTPTEVMSDFDFTVTQFAVESPTGNFVTITHGALAVTDIRSKRLRFVNVRPDIFGVWNRVNKYTQKGFSLTPDQAAKIFELWANTDEKVKEQFSKLSMPLPFNPNQYELNDTPPEEVDTTEMFAEIQKSYVDQPLAENPSPSNWVDNPYIIQMPHVEAVSSGATYTATDTAVPPYYYGQEVTIKAPPTKTTANLIKKFVKGKKSE